MPFALPSLRELGGARCPKRSKPRSCPRSSTCSLRRSRDLAAAIFAPLAWAVGAGWWRAARGRTVPGMMLLALVTLLARSMIAFAADSTFVYFLQPSLGRIAVAGAFLVSVAIRPAAGAPLRRRLLCPPAGGPGAAPVHRCFRRLSVAWGIYGVANAALGRFMLTALTPTAYVALRTPLSVLGTAAMVALSTVWFRHGLEAETVIEPRR